MLCDAMLCDAMLCGMEWDAECCIKCVIVAGCGGVFKRGMVPYAMWSGV